MTEETIVETEVPTQTVASEPTETPEVVAPEPDAEPKPEEQPQEDPVAKLQARFDRRINKATAARYQADARAQQAEERAAALAAELAQYRAPQDTPTQQAVDPVQLANAIATVREVTQKSNAIAKDGAARFADFNKALATVVEESGPLFTQHGFATPLGDAVLTSDDPAQLLHYLGTRPDIAADLADLTPTQLGRRMERIERELKEASLPKASSAPKPLTPVKASAGAPKDPSSMSDHEFAEWRKRQIAQRR